MPILRPKNDSTGNQSNGEKVLCAFALHVRCRYGTFYNCPGHEQGSKGETCPQEHVSPSLA